MNWKMIRVYDIAHDAAPTATNAAQIRDVGPSASTIAGAGCTTYRLPATAIST